MASLPSFVGTPKTGLAQVVNADGTTAKTLVTAGSSGSKVVGISACSTDSSSRTFKIFLVRSSVSYLIGTVTVSANAGNNGSTAAADGMSLIPGLAIDNDGESYFLMESGDTLQVQLSTGSVTASQAVSFQATYGDF